MDFLLIVNCALFLLTLYSHRKLSRQRVEFKKVLGFSQSIEHGSKDMLDKELVLILGDLFNDWIKSEDGRQCVESMKGCGSNNYKALINGLGDAFLTGVVTVYRAHKIHLAINIDKLKN